jgi:hypothetical protein
LKRNDDVSEDTENVQMVPKAGEVWRHYRGQEYLVLGAARLEAAAEMAVVYRDVRDDPRCAPWVRSLADWQAKVPGHGARFTLITRSPAP